MCLAEHSCPAKPLVPVTENTLNDTDLIRIILTSGILSAPSRQINRQACQQSVSVSVIASEQIDLALSVT